MKAAADSGSRPMSVARGVSVRLGPADHAGAEASADAVLDECRALCRPLAADHLRLIVALDEWRDPAIRRAHERLAARAAESLTVTVALYRGWPVRASRPLAWTDDASDYCAAITDIAAHIAAPLGARCEALELADVLGPVAWPDGSGASIALLQTLRDRTTHPIILGGLPLDPAWLRYAQAAGVLAPAAGLGFEPATAADGSTADALRAARAFAGEKPLSLSPERLPASPGPLDRGLTQFADWIEAPADRVYLPSGLVGGRGTTASPGSPSLVDDDHTRTATDLAGRLLRHGGIGALRTAGGSASRDRTESAGDLIIGGAGFIGCNLAARLAAGGRPVTVFDNLSRPGTEENLDWLRQRFPERVRVMLGDIRDRAAVGQATARAERVFHLAAQVAVTHSLTDPRHDHAVNATGTLNVLEALRGRREPPPLILTSTNKVYGDLSDLALRHAPSGYEPVDAHVRAHGINEARPLALLSPYGCSKGAADQYVLDYARGFGLPALVFRMSCIYGPRQFGNEDQGWVAHFARQSVRGEPVTLYGDGDQVRDILFIDDLVDALLAAMDRAQAREPEIVGQAFNIGGGAGNAISLRRLLEQLRALHGTTPPVQQGDWRAGDQRYYVSDCDRFHRLTGWSPRVGVAEGVRRLYEWMRIQEQNSPERETCSPDAAKRNPGPSFPDSVSLHPGYPAANAGNAGRPERAP